MRIRGVWYVLNGVNALVCHTGGSAQRGRHSLSQSHGELVKKSQETKDQSPKVLKRGAVNMDTLIQPMLAVLDTTYTAILGDTSYAFFWKELFPLLLAVLAPLTCLICAFSSFIPSGLAAQRYPPVLEKPGGQKAGHRVVRRITLAIRADVRMGAAARSRAAGRV